MNIKEIASKLIGIRENKMSSFIMSGQLREELGFEGYGEALRRRWIMADMEGSGMIQITNHLGTVAEMRELAEEFAKECKDRCGSCGKNKCGCSGRCDSCKGEKCTCTNESKQPVSESAHLAVAHAMRTKQTLDEIATLGLGRQPDSAGTPVAGLGATSAPAAPAAGAPISRPDPASPTRPQSLDIGTDVNVVENGKTYAGKVSQVKPDGKVRISFGGEKPSAERDYDKSEVTPLANA